MHLAHAYRHTKVKNEVDDVATYQAFARRITSTGSGEGLPHRPASEMDVELRSSLNPGIGAGCIELLRLPPRSQDRPCQRVRTNIEHQEGRSRVAIDLYPRNVYRVNSRIVNMPAVSGRRRRSDITPKPGVVRRLPCSRRQARTPVDADTGRETRNACRNIGNRPMPETARRRRKRIEDGYHETFRRIRKSRPLQMR